MRQEPMIIFALLKRSLRWPSLVDPNSKRGCPFIAAAPLLSSSSAPPHILHPAVSGSCRPLTTHFFSSSPSPATAHHMFGPTRPAARRRLTSATTIGPSPQQRRPPPLGTVVIAVPETQNLSFAALNTCQFWSMYGY